MSHQTTDTFPHRYHEERLADGVRYTLPPRRLHRLRWAGAAVLGTALFAALFLCGWMAIPVAAGWQMIQQGGAFGWALCAFGALALFGLNKCWGLMLLGVAILTNRTACEVALRDQELLVHERYFGCRWTRKIDAAASELRGLHTGAARLEKSQADNTSLKAWLGDYDHAIFATQSNGKSVMIVACYPRQLLSQLADALADQLPEITQVTDQPLETNRVMKVEQPWIIDLAQPADSDIAAQRRPDGTTYRVPAAGFAKGAHGLHWFAIFWNSIVAILMIPIVTGVLTKPAEVALEALNMLPFLAIGIGVALAAINMARRKTAIVTAGHQLMVISEGIFGQKTRTWNADELKFVCVGPSELAVNDVPVMELQFHQNGGKFGVLSELSNDELNWLAARISHELGLIRSDTELLRTETTPPAVPAPTT